jgi:hypothetical protein
MKVVGLNAWHWNTWGSIKVPGPDAYVKVGASEFPTVVRRLREIGAIIGT